ncbi:uncharacterized protein [Henckelia pumila]|uniref:uncharacterized protein n=1 Tax=Henckelia pumila TaxID=405737 RepID=UPI003C6DF237
MPPNFFLYLLERLLILAPRPDGCFFTTKSSFVEWIVCQPPNANPSPALATDVESSLTSIDDLSFGVVNHFLDKDTDFLKEWIRCSNIDHNYFPVLVLKLIMILCLVCLNSRMSLDILFELLARPLIRSHLQKQFYEALMCGKANNSSSIVTVAAALKAIGDPMVIVTLRENNFNLVCPDAIFLDLGLFSCKSDVINVLFPRSTGTSNARVGTDEGSVIESGIGFSGIGHIPGKSTTALEMMPKSTDANSASENEKVELQLRWGFLGDVLDMLLFHRSKENGNLKTVAPEKKLEVQEHMNFLAAALLQLTEHESRLSMTDENMCEAQNTIEELKQLSSLLDKSNLDGDEDLSEIEELVKSLELRRPRLEDMLSSVLDTNSSNTKVLNFGKDSLSNLEDWQI